VLQVDVLSAFVICGAGSLVGAAIITLVDSPEPLVQQALRLCRWAFVLLGVAMGSALVLGPQLGPFSQGLMAAGSLCSLVVFRWGLALLAGRQAPGKGQAAGVLMLCVVVGGLGIAFGDVALAQGLALMLGLISTWIAIGLRRFVEHPRDGAERTLGLAAVALASSTWIRFAFVLDPPAQPPSHLILVPDWLLSPLAVLYGVLPIMVATVVLSVVNARLRRDLSARANTDELTGAMTRRALREAAPQMLDQHRNDERALAVLMLDLDHFKRINDQHGHANGDRVLRQAAQTLRDQLRPDAVLARYGGEEFVALVPVAALRHAREVAERLCTAVASAEWRSAEQQRMQVTVSVGVALVGDSEALDAALKRADEALYRAKRDGRNQVQVALAAA
jgi:diguanylate cyclase (GGDEF)-like protein